MRGSGLVQQDSLGEVLVEVSALHVLRHHAQGVAAHTHAQQPDDVGVFQAGQDLYLLQEVVSDRMSENM